MKKIFAISVIAICLSILASATAAYFTDQATARNVITAGAVDVAIVEYPAASAERIYIMPGTTVSRSVSVRAEEADSYVRMKYEIAFWNAEGEEMELDEATIMSIVKLDVDETHWTENTGWWYLNEALESGKTAEPLFTEVVFSGPEMTNDYQGCTIEIGMTTQAVQAANNGATVWEAAGWPN